MFLSYASQDAEAAQRICNALRASGVEVWFDKSELRGGDAWDQSIRRQIKTCALLIPIVSRHTHERAEGYFRLEWKLAVDRSHLIMANKAFLLPIVIDDTGDDDENVPDKFREVQWTRLPAGETPPAFVERIQRLLSGELAPMHERALSPGTTVTSGVTVSGGPIRRRMGALYGAVAAAVLLVLGYIGMERLNPSKLSVPGAASIAVLPLTNESGEASPAVLLRWDLGRSDHRARAICGTEGDRAQLRVPVQRFQGGQPQHRSEARRRASARRKRTKVRGHDPGESPSSSTPPTGAYNGRSATTAPYKDLFALQDEITNAVAEALKPKLLPGEHAAEQSDRPASGNLEAYNAVLQGRFYARRNTEADHRKAIEFYLRATELDPRYALAWSQLSRSWTELGVEFPRGHGVAGSVRKGAGGRRPRCSPSHPSSPWRTSSGVILLQTADLDWRGAEAEYRRALALAPNDAAAQFDSREPTRNFR